MEEDPAPATAQATCRIEQRWLTSKGGEGGSCAGHGSGDVRDRPAAVGRAGDKRGRDVVDREGWGLCGRRRDQGRDAVSRGGALGIRERDGMGGWGARGDW